MIYQQEQRQASAAQSAEKRNGERMPVRNAGIAARCYPREKNRLPQSKPFSYGTEHDKSQARKYKTERFRHGYLGCCF